MSRETRRVLITGGASGLGLALAKAFLARGDEVLVGDLAVERPDDVPAEAAYRKLDVRSQQDWDAALLEVEERWRGLDVLVNNAGVATGGRIDVESFADWQRVIDINLMGVVRGCQTFVPLLKEQGEGRIVNVASLAGLVHAPAMSSYNTAKAGVVALSETLRFELAPFGIRVNVVCPAFFRTNLHTSLQGKDTEVEESAVKLITRAGPDGDVIAAKVMSGIDKDRKIILTDKTGYVASWAKRVARPAYDIAIGSSGLRLAKRGSL